MQDVKPPWMVVGESYIGTKEIPGPATSTAIAGWLDDLRAWWHNDEVPWCGVYVAHCAQKSGLQYPKDYYRAKSWASWGQPLRGPAIGAIVVFERTGGGHVGIVAGYDPSNPKIVQVLGGNQKDSVSVMSFDTSRVTAYRWPANIPLPLDDGLARMWAATLPLSTNEA